MQDMTFSAAQADMRTAYAGGVPGILVSGSVWMMAGVVALHYPPHTAVLALLAGGMLIFPLAVLLVRLAGRTGQHAKGNPLGQLALEGTVWMLLAMAMAYGFSLVRADLFFPAMLLIISGRYFTFATLYGMRLYWAFGAALGAAAYLVAAHSAHMATGAFAGGLIELVFAALIYASLRSRQGVIA